MRKTRLAAIMFATTISLSVIGCGCSIKSKEIPTNKNVTPSPQGLSRYIPQPKDFTITIGQTAKKCFKTAGCNISFKINPKYNGPLPDPTKTFTVSYKVSGGDAGEYLNSFTLMGTNPQFVGEEFVSVKNDKVVPQVTVTQVAVDKS